MGDGVISQAQAAGEMGCIGDVGGGQRRRGNEMEKEPPDRRLSRQGHLRKLEKNQVF